LSRQLSTSQLSDTRARGEGPSSTALDAWARLLRGHAALRRTLSAQLQDEHGLSVTDYEALLLLSRAEDQILRRVDLADGLGLSPSGVTRLLDGLERQGLVGKRTCESDARVTYAALSAEGRRRLEESSRTHIASIEAVFAERYDDGELDTLAELLHRLPGAGGASGAACSADGE
jgi:DNA-binding MarR family transcriptional regulator